MRGSGRRAPLAVPSSAPRLAAVLAVALLAGTAAAADPPAAADGVSFAPCEALAAGAPGTAETGSCFYEAARATGAWDEAAARLRHHLAETPDAPWLHYYLANVLWPDRAPEVVDHYRRSAELLEAEGDPGSATRAWLNLASFLRLTYRQDEAAAALERALAAARAHGDAMQVALVEIEQARQLLQTGQDFARAYWQLRRIEEVAFPDGPYALRRDCLTSLGMVAYNLGRWDEVRTYRRRAVALARAEADPYFEASMLYGLAAVELADPLGGAGREALVAQYREVLAVAREAGHRIVEAQALKDLGQLVGGEEGIRLLEECAAVTREVGQTAALSACLRGLAVLVAPDDPDRADALLDQALGSALAAGEPWPMVYGWVERLAVRWQTRPREEALADSLRALDLIQALRELQGSETGRLGMGAVWSEAYYWLSGRLLGSQPSRREVEVAFDLAEQARSRSLLEDLAAPERTPEGAPDPAFQETVQQIVDLHRRLLDPATADGERRLLLERLDELEIREAALREGSRARAGVPEPVRLDGVQAALAPGEALLAFQLSPWQNPYGEFGGGSWLLVATRDRVRIHPVPDRSELQPMTDLLLGMVQRRDGSDAAAAAAFGARLLGAALAELPPDVHSLVIVPDGPLHQVPFAALRTAPGEPPLVERYRLSTVPSATLWAGWRRHPRPPDRRGALVFADPTPAGADPSRVRRPPADGAPILRNAALAVAWTPGPLPQARHEGRRVTALLGSGSRLLVGDGASEARAKGDVADVVAVHFAAHALVDGARPQRSAVLLAPGGGGEDGLLQAREIAALDLDDRLVVLSACRGASGTVLQGEGAMSLARAFFQAGARAVVAAPWPLRDDEARQLTEALYRRLARGEDLAGALAGAQREQARQGAPAAAWAGLQLHGDGAWTPFAPRTGPWRRWVLLAAAAGLLLLLAVLAVRAGRTRRRRPA